MVTKTYWCGTLLLLLGLGTYWATEFQHATALIPAYFGIVFLILAKLSAKEHLRKHMMHVAAALALLGIFATISAVPKLMALLNGAEVDKPLAVAEKAMMALILVVFEVLCINSFVQARVLRNAN